MRRLFSSSRASTFALLLLVAVGCGREKKKDAGVVVPAPLPEEAMLLPSSDLHTLTFPTRQTNLADTNIQGVYQPTASGDPASGTYGSVRTGNYGNKLLPRFHEGVDIQALARDPRGRPLDDVFAAVYGRVALVHRHAGNSDYGVYVVLLHNDPVGKFYTLYGHMAEADPAIKEGMIVEPGTRLGRMGNTAVDPIPMSRAHLHFEIGFLANDRFLSWPRLSKKPPTGGLYNGRNLWGLNPILVYRDVEEQGGQMSLLDHIRRTPIAFEIITSTRRLPDFFERHPALWAGSVPFSGALVLASSEGGVVLAGRPATPEEAKALGRQPATVLRVNEAELGRNARRIVVKRNGRWELGSNGDAWLNLLLY